MIRMDSKNNIHIEFMDPQVFIDIVKNPEIDKLSLEVKLRIERVMNAL